MAFSKVITGAEVKIYLGGKLFPEAQSVSYTIDYGETEIWGIDSQYPQEITPTRISVQGTISGIKVKMTGGLQGYNARPKITDILFGSYVSLELRDRQTNSKLLFIPQMKVTSETFSAQAKGTAKLSFKFKGIVPYNEIDLGGSQ